MPHEGGQFGWSISGRLVKLRLNVAETTFRWLENLSGCSQTAYASPFKRDITVHRGFGEASTAETHLAVTRYDDLAEGIDRLDDGFELRSSMSPQEVHFIEDDLVSYLDLVHEQTYHGLCGRTPEIRACFEGVHTRKVRNERGRVHDCHLHSTHGSGFV